MTAKFKIDISQLIYRMITMGELRGDFQSELRVHLRYAGRSMYGAQCVGISGHQQTVKRAIAEVYLRIANEYAGANIDTCNDVESQDQLRHAFEQLSAWRQDNMGRDTIIYFPDMQTSDETFELEEQHREFLSEDEEDDEEDV